MKKIYAHDPHQTKLIHKVLELNLAVWLETQKILKALHPKTKSVKPKLEVRHMATLQDALDQLAKSVNDSTSAADRLIAFKKQEPASPEQIQSITDASATLDAKTAEVNATVDAPPTT